MDPNIDDDVFEEVTETKVDVTQEENSAQKSLKALLNVSKKTKKTSDRPGSELSFQSVNEISSIGMLILHFWSQDPYILFIGDSTKCENLLYFARNELYSVQDEFLW